MATLRDPGTYAVVIGSVTGGVGALIFQVVAGRSLGAGSFAPISTVWTILFLLNTITFLPAEQYVTRELASSRRPQRRVFVLPVVVSMLAAGAVIAWNLESIFESNPVYLVLVVGLVVGLGSAAWRRGQLAGTRSFTRYGVAMLAQTALLLVLGLAASVGWPTSPAFVAALALSPLAILLVRVSSGAGTVVEVTDRTALAASDGLPQTTTPRFVGPYIVASASAQTLLAGAPVAVLLLGGSPEQISVTFVVFTLLRAPLTLLYAVQARLLPSMVTWADRGETRRLRRFAMRVSAVSGPAIIIGAIVGAVVGPSVIEILYGADFRPSAAVASAVVAGVLLATATQLVALIVVARGATTRLAVTWFAGLAVALIAMLVVPGEVTTRVAIAFLVGEAVALALTTVLVLTWPGRSVTSPERGQQ